jgi:molybdenum cofactor cytidylyltransferase
VTPAAAIVPAAGSSRRMGRPKLLLPFAGEGAGEGGGTVIGATLAALAAGGAGRIAVVTREGDRPLRAWLRGEAAAEIARRTGRAAGAGPELVAVANPHPERGMLSSIVIGLEALGGPRRRGAGGPGSSGPEPLLVCPADLPELAPATVAAVLSRLAASGAELAVPVQAGRRGHPLAIAAGLAAEIPGLDPAVGLRQLLERHPDRLAEVPVADPGCIRDLDTAEDYRRLRGFEP